MTSITLLFGTETGNSESASKTLAAALHHAGYHVTVTELAAKPPSELAQARLLLIITSTYGSGDAPVNAEKMLRHLESHPDLSGVRYGVCALGDSTYPNFAQCGRNYDRLLSECGAQRVIDLCVCDVDYEEYFPTFQKNVTEWLKQHGAEFSGYVPPGPKKGFGGWLKRLFGGSETSVQASGPLRVAPPSGPTPISARVLGRRRLNGSGSQKETWHYELELSDPTFSYETGDCIAVHATNSSAEVARFLARTGLDGTAQVLLGTQVITWSKLLETRDLRRITPEFATLLARGRGPLAEPGTDSKAYRQERHLLEALTEHEGLSVTANEVLEALLPIAPRLYSVASSPRLRSNVVHLTVETPRYQKGPYARVGLASGYLSDRVQDGDDILVHKVSGAHFRNAAPDADVIWIGPGTGVAPYRGFLQERALDRGAGRTWLFFGHQHQSTDFLYGQEWQAQQQAGVLTRLDCAWSRDQAEKVYVQHLIEQHGAEIWGWIQGGAIIYVCGDKQRMASDVEQTFVRLAEEHGGLDHRAAQTFVHDLEKTQRYRVDVY